MSSMKSAEVTSYENKYGDYAHLNFF